MLPQVSQGSVERHGLETTAAFQGSAWSQLESVVLCSVTSVLGFTVSVTGLLSTWKGEQDKQPGPPVPSIHGAASSVTQWYSLTVQNKPAFGGILVSISSS